MRFRSRLFVIFLAGPAIVWAAGPAASPRLSSSPQTPPQAPPVFKVTSDTVEVDALVLDKRGAFARGLGKDDFVLLEDGVPQTISTFELVDIQKPGATPQAHAPDARPDMSAVPAPRSRLYFIVFDDYHIAPEHSSRARKLASDFVAKYLGPSDRAAVLFTSARRGASQDITSDRAALNAAIGRLVGHKVESAAVTNYSGNPVPRPRAGQSDPTDPMRFDQAKSSLETLAAIGKFAASIHGERKALVLISSGMDFEFGAAYGGAGDPSLSADDHTKVSVGENAQGVQADTPRAIRDAFRAFANEANRANVSLYAIDPRGVSQGGESSVMMTGTEASQTMFQDEVGKSYEGLRSLAASTNGQAFVGTSNFDRAFRLIVEATSTYYLMSYVSTSQADGKFHKIELRTARPGLTIRARPGFVKAAAPRS